MRRATRVAAILACFSSFVCLADEAPETIVLLSLVECCPDEFWPEAEKALLDEFEAASHTVRVVHPTSTAGRSNGDDLRRQAEKNGACCAVRIVRSADFSSGHIEIWTKPPTGAAAPVLILKSNGKPDSEEAQVLALRTVEAFRSRRTRTVRKKPDVVASKPIQKEQGKAEKTLNPHVCSHGLALGFGVGAITSPGDIGLMPSFHGVIQWNRAYHLSFSLDGAITLRASRLERKDSAASFNLAAVRVWMTYYPEREAVLRPAVGIGAGILLPWTTGESSEELRARTDLLLTGYFGILGQIEITLVDGFLFQLVVKYGLVVPTVDIKFGQDYVTTFRTSLIESSLGLAYQF